MARKFLRYKDLLEQGIFRSRMTMKRAVDRGDFPPGRLLSPNCRAWTEEERDEYIKNRPVARKTAGLESTPLKPNNPVSDAAGGPNARRKGSGQPCQPLP
jgi:predicted DNA-binding transcriptional regulator AlpA